MSNINNEGIKIEDIVKNIERDSYLVPRFQRNFVWASSDISSLGDSIIRRFPISSILIMPTGGNLKVSATGILVASPMSVSEEDDAIVSNKYYILDGQQRITAISKIFLDNDQTNGYYFDLLAMLVDRYPNDKIMDSDLINKLKNNPKYPRDPEEFLCRKFSKNDMPDRHEGRFILGRIIIKKDYATIVFKFLQSHFTDKHPEFGKYMNYLTGELGQVGSYSIPLTTVEKDSDLDLVIRVFEKVNSTGKKLTIFNLIHAKSFETKNESYREGGLSEYLTHRLSDLEGHDVRSGVDEFFDFSSKEKDQVFHKLDRITRIFEIAGLLQNNSTPSITSTNMLKRDADFWFSMWNTHEAIILNVLSWLNAEGLLVISQNTFFEYLIAIFIVCPNAFKSTVVQKEVKKYALRSALMGRSFSKSNLDIVEKLFKISKQFSEETQFNKYRQLSDNFKDIHRGEETIGYRDILEHHQKNAFFHAVICILYSEHPCDKCTHDLYGAKINSFSDINKMDYHHIYPKSRVSTAQRGRAKGSNIFDSIANMVLINKDGNRKDIRDKLPSEYVPLIIEHIHSSPYEARKYFEKNFIDEEELSRVNNEESAIKFIENRAKKIADAVNTYLKISDAANTY